VAQGGRLRDALAQVHDDELIALTRELVRIPSVVKPGDPDGNEAAVADHVHRWFLKEGFEVVSELVAPSRPNVVAWLGEQGTGPSLLLEGHTDVVTEGSAAAWSHPPFSGDVDGGRIWGRGAADMKGGLAAAMIAAAAIKRSGARLGGRLVVGALVDEEGDMLGVRHFVATPLARALTAAIICEPEQNELCLEQRGVVWARVTLRGRMAHGAMPEAGANPLAAAGALLREASHLERRLRRLCARSKYLRPPTVTPTVVRGPAEGLPQSNVIPATAEVILDVRLTPGPDAAAVAAEIDRSCRTAAQAQPGVTVEWHPVNGFRSATRVERSERLVRTMTAAVKKATGRRAVFGGVPGSTDGTILRETLGIPIVTCGPGHRLIPHQVDEHVEIAELVACAQGIALAALRFCGVADG
jgi:succinyl-diaminopimelate desuccinylase